MRATPCKTRGDFALETLLQDLADYAGRSHGGLQLDNDRHIESARQYREPQCL